ncbi:hypothetical protein [Aridibaculum aurantiacum]|uniref:hypothetical protein n=1 Tax=Aridibaculum aurantiacum TaxID=2810307 RepID=UPI001A95D0C8|nr:hypothetical protein [Aridibaculum aurantiacum]
MANTDDIREDENPGEEKRANISRTSYLPDSPEDEAKMQPEEVILDLPDVKDIPGQEFIHPPHMESFADTTIASDDEEGVGIFGDEEGDDDLDVDMRAGTESDVSEEEVTMLERADSDMPTQDDINLRRAELDQTDDEGEEINEGSLATDVSGSDLDTTVVDTDDAMERIGEEDEENNHYSLGSDSNDNVTEGTP